MDGNERTVGLVAVGVDKTNVLSELKGAASGARGIAEWLKKQEKFGVSTIIHLLTDEDGKKVRYADIKDATQNLINDGGLDLLILYFSGHGIVKDGSYEQLLLSEVNVYPNEAVNIYTTIINSRYSKVKHIVVISDACRNAVDPYGDLGQIYGSPIVIRKNIVGIKPSKVDVFYATEPSQTAKELRGEGFFTKILLEALNKCPPDICETSPLHLDKTIIPSWKLEEYLNSQIPYLAQQENPSFDQMPDISVTSRDPLFLGYALSHVNYNENLNRGISDLNNFLKKEEDFSLISGVDRNRTNIDNQDLVQENEYSNYKIKRDDAFKSVFDKLHSNMGEISKELLLDAGIYEDVREYVELEKEVDSISNLTSKNFTGYYISGVKVVDVIFPRFGSIKMDCLSSYLDFDVINLDMLKYRGDNTILVVFETGTFILLPLFVNYRGVVNVKNGLVKSISLTLLKSKFNISFSSNRNKDDNLLLRRACVAAFASNGRLEKLAQKSSFKLANFIRKDKRIDPILGIYASYAYVLSGNQEGADSIYKYFDMYQSDSLQDSIPIPSDIVLLSNELKINKKFAPLCPMMSLGWSLLDSYVNTELLDPLIIELGKRRLNTEWSTFSVESNLDFINAFINGKI